MFDLPHLRAFSIQGPDARAFGQSQITANLESFKPNRWYPSAWCHGQGKVRANLLIRVAEDQMDWVLPATHIDKIRQDLQPFGIGRRLRFGPPTSVCGEFSDNPPSPLSFDLSRGLEIKINTQSDAPDEMPDDLIARWRCVDILQGWVWLSPELSQSFLPQALGLERLGGLSYKKGCYPGQEVIAKVHYRGKLKQHLMLIRWSDQVPMTPVGAPVFPNMAGDPPQTDPANRTIGTLLESADGWSLAVISAEQPAGTEVCVKGSATVRGQIQELEPLTHLDPLS